MYLQPGLLTQPQLLTLAQTDRRVTNLCKLVKYIRTVNNLGDGWSWKILQVLS